MSISTAAAFHPATEDEALGMIDRWLNPWDTAIEHYEADKQSGNFEAVVFARVKIGDDGTLREFTPRQFESYIKGLRKKK